MVSDPAARAKLRDFFLQWLKIDPVPDLSKESQAVSGIHSGTCLRPAHLGSSCSSTTSSGKTGLIFASCYWQISSISTEALLGFTAQAFPRTPHSKRFHSMGRGAGIFSPRI